MSEPTSKKPTAKAGDEPQAEEPQTAATDARHPDTTADAGSQPPALDPGEEAVISGEQQEIGGLDPKVYGFRPIEVVERDETGPGAVEPVRVEPLSQIEGSSFTTRAQARRGEGKAVQPPAESKAVQSAENK